MKHNERINDIVESVFNDANITFNIFDILEGLDNHLEKLGLPQLGDSDQQNQLFDAWINSSEALEFGGEEVGLIEHILTSKCHNRENLEYQIPYKASDIINDPYGRLDWYSEIIENGDEQLKTISLNDSNIKEKLQIIFSDWIERVHKYGEEYYIKAHIIQKLDANVEFILKRIELFKKFAFKAIYGYINNISPCN